MSTSGSYNFSLSNSSIILEAFSRIGIEPTALTREQTTSAIRSLNLELQSFANRGPNLWEVQKQSTLLDDDVATYDTPTNITFIFEAYIRQNDGQANQNDRIITPLSVNDYAMIPNKQSLGLPTIFWYDRQIDPKITLWQVPNPSANGGGPWLLQYYYMSQVQDANIGNGEVPQVPFRFIDALCAGVAARLARKYAPLLAQELKAEAAASWLEAAAADVNDDVPMYISPQIRNFYVW